jgi:hypothetical protein
LFRGEWEDIKMWRTLNRGHVAKIPQQKNFIEEIIC